MGNYVLYTDSTADLTPELIELANVKVIPMLVSFDGGEFYDYADQREMDTQKFYDELRAGKSASTSLVNTERYVEVFAPELAAGNDVLFICFSSGLSGSFNCANIASAELAEKYPNNKLVVVDSRAASCGEGLLVYLAAMQKKEGMDIDGLGAWIADNRDRLCHWFTVDDLDFLKRGGRVSAAAAYFGGMLNIKPVLHVDNDGHLIPVEKVRGRKAALEALVKHMEQTAIDPSEQVIFIGHGGAKDDCDFVASLVEEKFHPKKIYEMFIGPVIGCHSGPGTIALFFIGDKK